MIVIGKIANDMPVELYIELAKLDLTKITDKEAQELVSVFNDFKTLIPLKKEIILSDRTLKTHSDIIKILNIIDYQKSDKNIIRIAINYLVKNYKKNV
jgi:hypothetical protein